MTKKSDNIFNKCIELILQGKREDLESHLRNCPEEAAELGSMLKTAFDVRRKASSIKPRPEFKDLVRTRLKGAQLYAKQQKQSRRTWIFALQQSWAYTLSVILIILLAGTGTVAASSNALPDDPLYQVKLAAEQIRLVFALSDIERARLHTQTAENRVREIAAMALEGNTEQVAIATEKLDINLMEANQVIIKVRKAEAREPSAIPSDGNSRQLTALVEGSTSDNITLLEDTLENTPEQTRPALRQAIDVSKDRYEKIRPQTDTETNNTTNTVQPNRSESSLSE